MSRFKGGKVGNLKKLKKSLDSSNATWVKYIKEDESITVRFLTEPDEWFRYYEHYDQVLGFFPCIGDECPGCESPNERTQYASQRYLANVVLTEEGKVAPLKMAKDLANRVVARFERYGTLLDRDYVLSRTGTFKDVLYDVDAEAPSALDLGRYDLLDLEAVLEEQVLDALGDDDDEPKPAKKKAAPKKAKAKKAPEPEVDDDDEEETVIVEADDEVPSDGADEEEPEGTIVSAEDDEDDEEVIELSEDELLAMSVNDLKSIAVQVGVDISPSMRKSALVDAILDAAEVVEE